MAGFALTEDVVAATQSRARLQLLANAGLDVPGRAAAVDESELKAAFAAEGAGVQQVAEALAVHKATRVSERVGPAVVIGGDQMLECDGAWFDKPANLGDARERLETLSGKRHRLITSVAVVKEGSRIWHTTKRAELAMYDLSPAFLDTYLAAAGSDICNSVGAYQLEGLGAHLFQRVEGDYFAILGLPLLELLGFLRQRGTLQP